MQSTENTPEVYPEDFAAFEAAMQPKTGDTKAAVVPEDSNESETAGESETPEDTEQAGDEKKPEEGEDEEGEKPESKRGINKRFRELTQKIRGLESELARTKPTESKPEVAKPAAAAADGKPVASNYDTYEAYTEALTEWTVDQREARRAAETRQREVTDKWETRLEQAREKFADFDEIVLENDSVPVTEPMKQAIFELDRGPEVAYYLAKNPAEAERIAKLSPIAAIRAIGNIEDGLTPVKPAPNQKQTPKASKAPEPITPVSRPSTTRATRFDDPNVAFSDFEKTMNRRQYGS